MNAPLEPGERTEASAAGLSAWFARLLPTTVVVRAAVPPLDDAALLAEELDGTDRMVPKRLAEFTTGRSLARNALAALGRPGLAVPRADDRRPVWPDGVVGSITHCDGLCAVAVGRTDDVGSLGIDAEPAAALPPDLLTMVCTAEELRLLEGLPPLPGGDWPRVIFSAKESFYKAWYPLTRSPLEFTEAEVALDPETAGFSVRLTPEKARLAPWLERASGRYQADFGYLATGVHVSPREA